jgi:molybdenum-dependent DNA-binding transcriptional regulator ModE
MAEHEYDEEEIHAALELAASVGPSAAARHLGVSRRSLYRWMEKYPRLWSDLHAGDPQSGRRGVARRLEDLADRYLAAEHDLLEKVEDGKIEAKDAKEAAALLKAMGSSRHAAVAGVRAISGEPDIATLNINFPALEQAMERLLEGAPQPALPVPNLAEEVEPDGA